MLPSPRQAIEFVRKLFGRGKPHHELTMSFTSKGKISREPVTLRAPEVVECSSQGISDFARQQFDSIGICIYCGAKDQLTREHIIPFALNGTAVLPMASCKCCAAITGQLETTVLRGPLRPARVLLKMRSRKKHSTAPKSLPLRIVRNKKVETVFLPLEEYPILVHFPVFARPRFLRGVNGTGIEMTGVITISFGQSPQTAGKKLRAQRIVINEGIQHPVALARMIGKIAYCMAIAQGQINPAQRPEIVSSILGEADDIGKWVGTIDGPSAKYEPGTLHRMAVARNLENGTLLIEVQLFADAAAPTYGVIFPTPIT